MHTNANVDENGVVSESFQCILLSDFLNLNDVYSMSEKNILKFKKKRLYYLKNKHHTDQKICYKRFSDTFLLCNHSRKNDNVN